MAVHDGATGVADAARLPARQRPGLASQPKQASMGDCGPWGGAGDELLGATLFGTAGSRPNWGCGPRRKRATGRGLGGVAGLGWTGGGVLHRSGHTDVGRAELTCSTVIYRSNLCVSLLDRVRFQGQSREGTSVKLLLSYAPSCNRCVFQFAKIFQERRG